ncbi:hypothetical protein GW930_02465 [Candidatus Saccharibacteria bacterium]|nr:hypothetical protein [Candidatus Saccharibacteria bacterium]
MQKNIETISPDQQFTMLSAIIGPYGRYVRCGKYADSRLVANFEERELERHVGYLDPRPDYIQVIGERLLQRLIESTPVTFDAGRHLSAHKQPRYEREFFTKEAGHFAPIIHPFFAKIALSKTIELTDGTPFEDGSADSNLLGGRLLFTDINSTVYASFDAIAARASDPRHPHRLTKAPPKRAS